MKVPSGPPLHMPHLAASRPHRAGPFIVRRCRGRGRRAISHPTSQRSEPKCSRGSPNAPHRTLFSSRSNYDAGIYRAVYAITNSPSNEHPTSRCGRRPRRPAGRIGDVPARRDPTSRTGGCRLRSRSRSSAVAHIGLGGRRPPGPNQPARTAGSGLPHGARARQQRPDDLGQRLRGQVGQLCARRRVSTATALRGVHVG